MSWEKVELGTLLIQTKQVVSIDNSKEYKLVTVSSKGTIKQREIVKGVEIKGEKAFEAKSGEFIYSRLSVHNGAFGIVPHELDGALLTSEMPTFEISDKILPEFLLFSLQLPTFQFQLEHLIRGVGRTRVKETDFLKLSIDLPNISDQATIVKSLILVEQSSAAISFELNHQLDLVKKLRQQLLKDAVKGKLTEHNEADEPAIELLKKIKAEKEKLISEKKLKKEKEFPPIKSEEIPFEVPENWVWCRLGEICGFITKGTTPSLDKIKPVGKIPYLKVYNIVEQKINFEYKPQYIDEKTHREVLTRSVVYPGDVLMNIVGPPLCKVAIVPSTFPEWNINQALAIFRPLSIEINRFMYFYLSEESAIKKLIPLGVVGQDNLSLEQCRNLIFPLPPMSEQNRIVQKLDELMKWCDELETSIKESKVQNEKLLQQVLREALRKEP
jgi:restriction endonuclease S subunit